MTHGRVGLSTGWNNTEAFWREITLSPRRQRDRADVHEAARLGTLLLGTLLFVSASTMLARAHKVGKPMTSVAAVDCVVVVAGRNSLRQ